MSILRRLALAALLALGLSAARAAAPVAVPPLPDAARITSYSITASTCACAVNFALFGNQGVGDYYDWVRVYLNGVLVNYNDSTYGWTITSPSGVLASLPSPITDAVLTFNNAQTGTVEIVGAYRPARLSQFSENAGVSSRNLNVTITSIIASLRETWDKVNGISPAGLFFAPGNAIPIGSLPACASANVGQPLVVSNGVSSPTYHQSVSTSAIGSAEWTVSCSYNGASYSWVY